MVDYWRVTVYHQVANKRNMRVLQLEHNTSVLQRELNDMYAHADKTRRESVSHLASVGGLQEDLSRERTLTAQLRRDISQQSAALAQAETQSRAARSEVAQLQERIASMDNHVRRLALEAAEKSGVAMQDIQRQLLEERSRSSVLVQRVNERDGEIARQFDEIEVCLSCSPPTP